MQKHSKSDIWKTWRGIFIGYSETTKHLRVWAPRIYQVLIASKPIVNKDKRIANLLMEHPLPAVEKSFRLQIGELKLRGQSHKSDSEKIIEDCGKLGKKPYNEDIAIE